jgi:TELO2-interacting protein 1
MVAMLKKLTSGAMLSPSEASEEFRGGVIRCFRAMILQLQPCSDSSCSCNQATVLPTTPTVTGLEVESVVRSKYSAQPEECLLAFLRSQNASAAVGHWLSLLLQVLHSFLNLWVYTFSSQVPQGVFCDFVFFSYEGIRT